MPGQTAQSYPARRQPTARPSLRKVWHAHYIAIAAPARNGDILHTSEIVFTSPAGTERYIAVPADDHTTAGTVPRLVATAR